MTRDRTDYTGMVFGRLTCIGCTDTKLGSDKKWLFRCQCGKEKAIRLLKVKQGLTRSCGCLQKELVSERFSTHRLSTGKDGKQTRLHRIWSNMKARCSVNTHFAFKNYGARGIAVCDDWFENYISFHEWAIANGYDENMTIERINNNKGYCPENCTWIPKSEQSLNQRNTKLNNEKACEIKKLAAAGVKRKVIAEIFGISSTHVSSIANGHRWSRI